MAVLLVSNFGRDEHTTRDDSSTRRRADALRGSSVLVFYAIACMFGIDI